ncbi:hypothetical protein Daesc_004592 [Daldinia eschscholtzii]|uniref:Wax synthase domain-containing protein n=1 Tax=Daldinia eschscholtzii TaxID=292717 RepID=A0AAX6MPR0_9PEZI
MTSFSATTTVQPLILYASAVALIFMGLYLPANRRDAILPLIWAVLAASMQDIRQLDWIPGFGYQFGMLVIITFLCSPLIFHTRKEPLKIEVKADGSLNWNLATAYKIYNNPRMLPINLEKYSKIPPVSNSRLVQFTLYRLLKAAFFVAIKIGLGFVMTPIFSTCTLEDFSPAREPIIRRLIYDTVSLHDLGIRAFISTIWIFDSVSQLEISHALVGVLFVAILRVDELHEWPPLFGSPLEAYSLRQFWGRFWHRLFTSAGVWARVIVDQKLLSWLPISVKKIFVAFSIFTMSGVAHALVGRSIGDSALERDVLFFWFNFLAVCFEIIVSKCWSTKQPAYLLRRVESQGRAFHVLRKLLGFLWVLAFFMWSTPRLVYPKIHALLLASITK